MLYMAERMVVIAVAFGGMLLFDWFNLKNKISKGEKIVYFILLLVCLYLAFDFIINKNWLDYFDLANPIFGGISKKIDDFLNVNK